MHEKAKNVFWWQNVMIQDINISSREKIAHKTLSDLSPGITGVSP